MVVVPILFEPLRVDLEVVVEARVVAAPSTDVVVASRRTVPLVRCGAVRVEAAWMMAPYPIGASVMLMWFLAWPGCEMALRCGRRSGR